jgi:HSP20 family protein
MSGSSLRPFGGGGSLLLGGSSPLELFQTLRQEMDRVFQQAGVGGLAGFGGSQIGQHSEQQRVIPPAEVTEDNENYRITLELPGIDPQNVEVNVSGNNTLTIQAQRRAEWQSEGQGSQQTQGGQQGQQGRNVLISERSYGRIQRSFHLPNDIDTNRVHAEFRHGLLNITLPKSSESRDQRRRIEIKTQ